jgi:hypothetical protein
MTSRDHFAVAGRAGICDLSWRYRQSGLSAAMTGVKMGGRYA